MNLIQTNSLSARQAEQILALLNECQKTQPIHISFPFEDGNCFLLLLDESETLAAIMGMILPPDGSSDEEPVECIAFTRPSLRRRGYFAALLEKACDISGEHDILFPVDPESADTAATMKAIHADRVDPGDEEKGKLAKLGGTDFGNNVAIPHPEECFVKENVVCVAILDKPIRWSANTVQLVILAAIYDSASAQAQKFYQLTSSLISDRVRVKRIIAKQEYEHFMKLLLE